MHKVILFRGGMCGDIILSMLNKDYISNFNPLKQNKERCLMKKFYMYSIEQKNNYYNRFNSNNKIEYTLSHDTNFCQTIKENVIQLYCSDISMLKKFSQRFWIKNSRSSVDHVIKDINSNEKNKIKDYEYDILNWQTAHIFPHRFDIKDVFKKIFVKQLAENFIVKNIDFAYFIHNEWLKTEI